MNPKVFVARFSSQPLSAGIVPVHLDTGRYRVLILRAYRNWDFPKGRLEPGETPLQAALRELEEETGIRDAVLLADRDYRETLPYGRGKVSRYYLAEVHDPKVRLPISPELGVPEHHEFRWAGFAQARELLPMRLLSILDWAEACVARRRAA